MRVPTARLIGDDRRPGVLAFNVITLEHAQGVLRGAEAAEQAVILQLSQNAIRYHGDLAAIAAAMVVLAERSTVEVALHLDHITEREIAVRAPEIGFGSVMFDASTLPYEENVARTAEVAAHLHAVAGAGLWVEGELGEIGGKGDAHTPGVRTDPEEAADFVGRTGVDGLAVAVGSQHAMATRGATLDLDLIGELAARLDVPLVLHGSSGVPHPTIRAAIAAGIRKVNIGTALNSAFTGAVRERLSDAAIVDPRRYLSAARSAVQSASEAEFARILGGGDDAPNPE
ncbi:class II fructose-bisphosphate aldolase [Agromyces aerolatus]|uniref:class II fructose-bisphosphate aldolase n=1 Tax=Agromyces sp. LY-1074 TaxID=3074080 RepID=UPI0028580CCA|nr:MULTISPECIES: class II fructose-bisphosphate aldolase [unclassified Agromyces]MDR5700893.1 class II fructose-bisphosphate aldolase [Agromyces sp. LY-1074]MDR5707446.1 class II fructose-bisphosphate aldolase [Agromyces sp. LY-1358]